MDIVPGQEYTFTLTPDDPAIAEDDEDDKKPPKCKNPPCNPYLPSKFMLFIDDFESGNLSTKNWNLSGPTWFLSIPM